MLLCPNCRKEIPAFYLDSHGPLSHNLIECGCGYVGLPARTG